MALVKIDGHAGRRRFPSLSGTRRWAATFIATIASAYALDAIAATTGIVLVASQILKGVDHVLLLLFLAGTYVIWGLGLKLSLMANWVLLEDTGTSTSVLSKAAYDLVKFRTRSGRACKIAAAAGYVGTELAKEAPYYVGAFGVALLTDSVSTNDALIFLGGANLGAGAYEYGLARTTRSVLHRWGCNDCASFETDWVPRDYLKDYYSIVEPDEQRTIEFLVGAIGNSQPDQPVLFFGVGPTLHHVFLAAGTASEIHLGDYLPMNLQEIERWMNRDPEAHDWRAFVRYTLECEGLASPTDDQITQREELTRASITRLLVVDIRSTSSLGDQDVPKYGTVISAYCADSVTDDRAAWETYMERIAGLVRPGGTLLTAALRRSKGYFVGGKKFPSANIDEHDIRTVLERHFLRKDLTIEACELEETASKGYSGIVLAQAHQRTS